MDRVAVKIANRNERVAYLEPETARQVVANGLGSYLNEPAEEQDEPKQATEPEARKTRRTKSA